MRLLEIGIENFKSLKSVTLKPGPLSVFIGPNGAGKSNLCEALDFIGEMYRSGLNVAMTTHGGFERLVFGRHSQSPRSLRFSVTALLSKNDLAETWLGQPNDIAPHEVIVSHDITISQGIHQIDDPFRVSEETIQYKGKLTESSRTERILEIRNARGEPKIWASRYVRDSLVKLRHLPEDVAMELARSTISSNLSMLVPFAVETFILPSIPLRPPLSAISLYELFPDELQRDGVPIPSPSLGRHGMHFPAVLAWLKSHHAQLFQEMLGILRTILPTLQDIDIVDRGRGRLIIEFRETGFDRPWTADDMSDGTIRTLGMLVGLFDPGSKVVIIEEPENSLHPWAIGQFVEACRLASQTKHVMLTTHSPVVIDQLKPEEIWVVSRPGAETKVDRLVDLDPVAQTGWDAGDFTISEFLDSGIVPGSVPAL